MCQICFPKGKMLLLLIGNTGVPGWCLWVQHHPVFCHPSCFRRQLYVVEGISLEWKSWSPLGVRPLWQAQGASCPTWGMQASRVWILALLLQIWPRAASLPAWCLSFLICKMEIIITIILKWNLWGLHEGSLYINYFQGCLAHNKLYVSVHSLSYSFPGKTSMIVPSLWARMKLICIPSHCDFEPGSVWIRG